jgi:hypothetical protein
MPQPKRKAVFRTGKKDSSITSRTMKNALWRIETKYMYLESLSIQKQMTPDETLPLTFSL